jgi:hypothetical protein
MVSVVFGLALSLLPAKLHAQATAPKPTEADTKYDAMLEKAKQSPGTTNWRALRIAFTETDRYQPYSREWQGELSKVRESISKKDFKAAEKAIVALRDKEGWTRLEVMMTAENIYDKLGDKKAEELHHKFIEGYLMTILQPDRGQSAKRPFEVIYVDEEYLILDILDEKRESQALMREADHWIDRLTTVAKGDKPARNFYFNVDLPRKQLEKMFKPPAEKPKPKAAPAKK